MKIKDFFIPIIFFIILFFFILIKDKPLLADENYYYPIIQSVSSQTFDETIWSKTSALPGYSFAIGFLRSIFDIKTIQGTRLITTFFSFFSVVAFYFIARKLDPKNARIKTLQYLFLPILFTFLFLLYTDVFSLFLILASFYFLIKKNYRISGLIALSSLIVRQNNIVWIIFFCAVLLKNHKFNSFQNFKKYFQKIFFFVLSFITIAIFILVNKGGTIGQSNQTFQPFTLHLQNVYFSLFVFFFLFLPLNFSNFFKIKELFKKKPKYFLLLTAIFLLYLFTFNNGHPWNQEAFNFYLRNKILGLASKDLISKIVFFVPIAYSLFSLIVTKLKDKSFYIIYPFMFLSISIFWLIEPRYYLPAFTFFLLFRKSTINIVEYALLFVFIILTIFIFFGTVNDNFFL